MNYGAIIFDFDYTLGDSTPGIVASVNYALTSMGLSPAATEPIRKTVGLSLKETYKTLTGSVEEEEGSFFASYFKEEADRVMASNTVLLPDVENVLTSLRAQPIKLGIVTTKYHHRIEQILKNNDGLHWFDRIVGSDDVSVEKPDPAGVLQLLNEWNLPADQVLYVGDSLVDAETAKRAGVPFVAVTTGTTSAEAFEAYPCHAVMKSLAELKTLLK